MALHIQRADQSNLLNKTILSLTESPAFIAAILLHAAIAENNKTNNNIRHKYKRCHTAGCDWCRSRTESINTWRFEANGFEPRSTWIKQVDLETLDWRKQREGRQGGLRQYENRRSG